jgi:hypothetical protein
MLTPNQIDRVWESMISAEVRSQYFAELTTRYTRIKQVLGAIIFFCSSGAAVSVGAKFPDYLALGFSVVGAAIAAYTISFGLDKLVATLARLHYSWNELSSAYERLWNHWYDDDAERTFEDLQRRAREASELGTEVPYRESLVGKWEERVYARYSAAPTA